MKKWFKLCLIIVLSIYLVICASIYFLQNQMLFPAYAARAVPQDWAPNLGQNDTQAMITGQCGKLHVVKWALPSDKGTIMIFHGNGESIASVQEQVPMFQKLGYSVMAWDYPGYGKSSNCWFNEDDLLRDSESAYQWLIKQTSVKQAPESDVILYGRSVGTGLALYIASQHQVKQVLLVSPYDALVSVAKDHMPFFIPVGLISHLPIHASQWLEHVKCKVRAIHGLNDTLISPVHAVALFKDVKANASIEWVAGAGHNDITSFEEYDRWLAKQLAD